MSAVASGLVDRVRARLVAEPGAVAAPSRVAAALRSERGMLGDADLLAAVDAITSELAGLGPLQRLVDDPSVTDVLVNGPGEVWAEVEGALVLTGVRFRDESEVRALAQRLAATAGRRVDDAAPFADVRLAGGVRLHVALAPVATRGTCLSLRVGRRRALSPDDLVAAGTVGVDGLHLLRALVEHRLSMLVTGGTGSGKTTLLATLLGMVDPGQRVVVVEDSAELRPEHPHTVMLEGRPPNLEGAGGLSLRDLVRQALRMRPDRLVVGEVRGPEVTDLLAALNTGHAGGFGTVHANAPADLPARLEALALPAGLGRDALHAQLVAGLDVVVHVERGEAGVRRVSQVAVPRAGHDGVVRVVPAAELGSGAVGWLEGGEPLRRRLGGS